MPGTYCGKCGTLAQPTDRFCRICGAVLDSVPVAVVPPQNASAEPGGASPKAPLSQGMACLIAVGLVFLSLTLVVVFFVFLINQPNGSPLVAVEIIGTATPYPTQRPYQTARPYPTSTPYPLPVPYPTTGNLAKLAPETGASRQPFAPSVPFSSSSGCELRIKNQNTGLDAVILLAEVDTNAVTTAVYVRASDAFTKSGISTGTYYIYVALGQDWDNLTGRFNTNAFYFRFKEPNIFNICSAGSNGSYQYVEITLNASEGTGSETVTVQPDGFPSISP